MHFQVLARGQTAHQLSLIKLTINVQAEFVNEDPFCRDHTF